MLDELNKIQKVEPENFKVAYAFTAIPARYALGRRRWDEAAKLTSHQFSIIFARVELDHGFNPTLRSNSLNLKSVRKPSANGSCLSQGIQPLRSRYAFSSHVKD